MPGQDNPDRGPWTGATWRTAARAVGIRTWSGEFFRKDSRLLSRARAFVVLIERADEEIKPMAPFAFIDRRTTTVELWMLLLLLVLISVAWLKAWD